MKRYSAPRSTVKMAKFTTMLIHPLPPFRLDLTVWALRRRPTNLIDRWDGQIYRRVVVVGNTPFEIAASQAGSDRSSVRITIRGGPIDARKKQKIRQVVVNTLGVGADLSSFYHVAARDRRLAPLARRFQGVKPPRFFSIFEALVNGIACQQLSLSLGIQLLNRLAQNFGLSIGEGDSRIYAFPRPRDLAYRYPEELRKLGFNFQKSRAIIEISQAIVEGKLNLENLTDLNDEEALQRLMEIRGVGRWTAEYTLLRGMGRWHIFPVDDQGARNGLARWFHSKKPIDAKRAQRMLARWRPYGGLIYFHMLMQGLDEAGRLEVNPLNRV